MKISSQGQYAIKALLQLALHEHEKPVSLVDIAGVNGISVSYLEQLFSKLRSYELIEGVRGPGGGYRLGKSSTQISVANIIDAIEDKPVDGAVEPKEEDQVLPLTLWNHLSEELHNYLEEISLADLLDHPDVPKAEIAKDTTSLYIASMFKPVDPAAGQSMN